MNVSMGRYLRIAGVLALVLNAFDLILIFDVVLVSTRVVLNFYSGGRVSGSWFKSHSDFRC